MNSFTNNQISCINFFSTQNSLKRHLIIEAGAGAGKTHTLVERVKKLLLTNTKTNRIHPSKLFIVTFSKNAAQELSERIEKVLNQTNEGSELFPLLHISTIDSFFAELVQCIYPSWWELNCKNKQNQSMPPTLQLITQENTQTELKAKILHIFTENQLESAELAYAIDFILAGGFKKGFSDKTGTLNKILNSMGCDSFLAASPNEIVISANKIHPATVFLLKKLHAIARECYQNRLLKGEMTYADKTVFLKENLKNNIPIAVSELIVDEYQDTNEIQHSILFQIVEKNNARMVVVGDPKQSIYGFRNANVDVFKKLTQNSTWKHEELLTNFRSSPLLLKEINHLSSLSFSFERKNFHEMFYKSYFYKEASHKKISEKPLIAGTQSNKEEHSPVSVVCTSLRREDKTENSDLKLTDYTFYCHSLFIKNYLEKNNILPSDCVVLCEKNSQINKIAEYLCRLHVPINYLQSTNTDNTISSPSLVALSLAKILANEHNSFDLYNLFNSPLCFIPHREIELYFSEKTESSQKICNIINLIEVHRIYGQTHFFKAWQLLRWKLCEMIEDKKSLSDSKVFCAQMDAFADALCRKLNSPFYRAELENKNKKKENVINSDLKSWEIRSNDSIQNKSNNSVTIKTVHSAKGLQWKVVFFFPMYGKANLSDQFILAKSSQGLDVNWLHEDTENLSVISLIQNQNFSELDCASFEKKNKTEWFAKLRVQFEELYERQRVFYTAFTRAKENLILLQPLRAANSKTGYRNTLSEIAQNSALKEFNYLEEHVYLNYIDSHFNLKNPNNKGTKKNLLPQVEPWTQKNEDFPRRFQNENGIVSFYEFGPQFAKLYTQFNEQEKQIQKNSFSDSIKITAHHLGGLNCLESQIQAEIPKQTETALQQIKQIQESRAKRTQGLVYHAAAENRPARPNTFQFLLESVAARVFHELEVWKKIDDKCNFINTSRNIIDMLAVVPKTLFANEHWDRFYHLTDKKIDSFSNYLSQSQQNAQVILICDFKTGQKSLEHVEQLKNYLTYFENLNTISDFLRSSPQCQYHIIGALCYSKTVDNNTEFRFVDNELPCYQSKGDEHLYFFTLSSSGSFI